MAKRLGVWLPPVPVGLRGYIGVAGGRSKDEGLEDSFGRLARTSPTLLSVYAYVFEVIWSDIDLYHAYRDFTTDPVRYPAEDMRNFISELASVPALGDWISIDIYAIVDRKRATLCTDRGRGDSRVNQQD